MAKNPVRNYAYEYVGGKGVTEGDALSIAIAAVEAAAEPTGDELGEVVDSETVVEAATAVNPPIVGTFSAPPTAAEIEAEIGAVPSDVAGQSWRITDEASGRTYTVESNGSEWTIAPTVLPRSNLVTLATSAGAVNGYQSQHSGAQQYGGRTYFGVLSVDGDIVLHGWDHAAAAPITPVLVYADLSPDEDNSAFVPNVDSHDTPVLLVDPADKRLLMLFAGHNAPALWLAESVSSLDDDPELLDGFTVRDLDAELGGTSSEYTYPMFGTLADQIVIGYRRKAGTGGIHADAEWAYSRAAQGVRTFAMEIVLAKEPSHGLYWGMSQPASDRLDFVCSNRSAYDEAGGSVFHFSMSSDFTLHLTDGTEITAALPLSSADMTPVWTSDGTQRGLGGGVELDAAGNPRIAMGYLASLSPVDARYLYARWDPDAEDWIVTDVATAGSAASGHVGSCFEPGSCTVIWLPQDVAGVPEMIRFSTLDDGATFRSQQVTFGSTEDNGGPNRVRDPLPELKVWWQHGTWTGNYVEANDYWGAGYVPGTGLDLQRMIVLDDDVLGGDLAEAIWRRGSDGLWYVSRNRGLAWEALASGENPAAGLLTVDAGAPSYDDSGDDLVVTYATDFGYDADGPYYDSTGAAVGEEAILALDPSTGELTVVPYHP